MAYTFVLVHGAWQGGWCWQRVADRLRGNGHKVFTPTLTGLGERSHLLRQGIDIGTHITDVVNVMKWEQLTDIVLCGHSYGGFVISGVAELMAPAIRSIVFLDAFLPNDGDTIRNLTSSAVQDAIGAALQSGALGMPPRPAEFFGVNAADREWVDSLCVPQPVGTFTDKIALTGARDKIARKTYIRAKNYANPGFDRAVTAVKSDPSWRLREAPSGHDVMVDAPERLTELLLEAAA
ncbi:MAG TPA: alpha/beta hydrolase [Xanthobacteraceae bacterium]|nr:alpha/beta hydrolase [Xanthobacteraceae bacterium]